jgi:hypothetical protein
MKKTFFLLLSAYLLNIGQAVADDVLTVSDVNVPQGGQATLEIGCQFDTEYTAFELQLSLPEGLSLLTDGEGYPVIEKAFDTNHILTGNLLPSNGNYKITCRSMENLSIPTSGALFRVTVQAEASLALGTNLAASVTACEFTRTADSQGENLADASFTVHITEYRTILDETSTTAPVAATGVNVRVNRTINANEWSTICLPFAMSESQVKTAFGNDVQLGDFNGYNVSSEGDAITVNFNAANAIEANHPYIIKVSEALTSFTMDDVDIDPEEEPTINKGTNRKPKAFIGNYVAGTSIDNGCLFLNDNKFWYSVGTTKIKAFRAYFNFFDLLPDFEENYAEAPIFISFDNMATGIKESVNSEELATAPIYNLKGQRVENPTKGLYIKNNKKVLVK